MDIKDKIDIDVFKVVINAVTESDDLETMTAQLTQLLVGALEIKGCTIFVLNPETEALESLASFGLSMKYLNKGPVLLKKSIDTKLRKEPIIISDIEKSDRLQYPQNAKQEGIKGIVSLPINYYGRMIGVLRLYHHDVWDISERDIDSLQILAGNIGMAITYTRILNALQSVMDSVNDIHTVWLYPKKG
ncbi:GAF domain-containing protein [Desulfonema magnum]|uniref:GAF domain-containing protein n=1 Tax=Desulfonema magnum TaxID=45655 RepID=A0A975BSA1_9BACT|nr:GAF domain-containing protein [Desulfonema magnum]QTA90512.1 GAF domain-containing protein [Desulfonema magnum]